MCIIFFNGIFEFEGSEKESYDFLAQKVNEGFKLYLFEIFEKVDNESDYDWYSENGMPVEYEDLEYATV